MISSLQLEIDAKEKDSEALKDNLIASKENEKDLNVANENSSIWNLNETIYNKKEDEDMEINLEKQYAKNPHVFLVDFSIKNKTMSHFNQIEIKYTNSKDLIILEDETKKSCDLSPRCEFSFKMMIEIIRIETDNKSKKSSFLLFSFSYM